MIVKRYSEDPNKYWPMIERFRLQTFKEGNDSLTHKKYNPDNPEIETWMSFKDETQELLALNSGHIVGECKPSETIMIHYAAALADADKYNKVRQAGLSLKEIEEKLKELSDEEMDAFISAKFDEIEKDSDTANIIQFKPKGTLH